MVCGIDARLARLAPALILVLSIPSCCGDSGNSKTIESTERDQRFLSLNTVTDEAMHANKKDPIWRDPWLPSSAKAIAVPVELHAVTYKVWAEEVGSSEAAVTMFVLNGGPGKPHTELDGLYSAWPEFKFIYWDSLGSHGSDCFNGTEPCTWHPQKWGMLDDFVTQARAVFDYFELAPSATILLAHSFGVVLALELAVRAAQGSEYLGLVLSDWVASQAYVTSWYHQHPCQKLLPEESGLTPDCMFIDTRRAPPPYVTYTFGSDNPGPLGAFVWGSQADGKTGWMNKWDRLAELSSIKSPAIWLAGEYDLVNPKDVKACADHMPRGRFVRLSAAGHNSFADVPAEWIDHVSKWMRDEIKRDTDSGRLTDSVSDKFLTLSSFPIARFKCGHVQQVAVGFVIFTTFAVCFFRHFRTVCWSFRASAYRSGQFLCENAIEASSRNRDHISLE